MHVLSAGLGVDQMALPRNVASLIPPVYRRRAPASPLPQQRTAVSESAARALAPWADRLDLPGMDT
jgi:hypothetical protein